MLSSLVRYQPKKWHEVCLGKNDDMILQINEFRKKQIPMSLNAILEPYNLPVPSFW